MDESIGERLRRYRKGQGLSLDEVAKRANLRLATLSRMELGQRAIRADEIPPLAAAPGIDPTQVPRLLARQVSPAWLGVAISRRLHMNLPASWFASLQARWLAALQRLRDSGATPAEVEAFTGRIEQVVAEATAGYAQAAAGKMRALRAAESIAEYGPTRPTPADE